MKAMHDFEDGPERSELCQELRRWPAPPVPEELEAALRFEFRRRRPRPGKAVWLSIAAAAALVAAWPHLAPERGGTPALPAPELRASAASALRPEPWPPAIVRSRPVLSPPRRRVPHAGASAIGVVVEPRQAELLAELGRGAWQRSGAPWAAVPQAPSTEAPAFRVRWEELAGEWPAVQVVVSESGR